MLSTLLAEHTQLRTQIAALRAQRESPNAFLEQSLTDFKRLITEHFQKEESQYRLLDQGVNSENKTFIHHLRNDHAAVIFGMESSLIRLRKSGPTPEWWTHFEKIMGVFEPHMEQEEKELFPGAFS